MGLDMYLRAKLYMGKYTKDKRQPRIRKIFPEMFKSGNLNSIEVKFEVGYWRKANQIHKWFVDNVQDGEDKCNPHYVSRDDLKTLLDVCEEVVKRTRLKKGKVTNGYSSSNGEGLKPNMEDGNIIANPKTAHKLLPTQDGCFFGGTEYNEWYLMDIKATIKIIKKCLKLPEVWDFEYRSSW